MKVHIKAEGRTDSLCHQHSDTKKLEIITTREEAGQARICTNCRNAWIKTNKKETT